MSKIQNRTIKPEFFVAKYMEVLVRGGTVRDVAKGLGLHSPSQVTGRAAYLRKMGVDLPRFPRLAPPVPRTSAVRADVLNSIVQGWQK